MKCRAGILLLAFGMCACCAIAARAHEDDAPLKPPQARLLADVHFTQRLDAQLPVHANFTDDRGERVTLAECMHDRPTVLVLAYFRCPMLCNHVLEGVARSLKGVDFQAGEDFEVVVVSFDSTDTVELAAGKKRSVAHAYGRDTGDAGWHFLIGAKPVVDALAESVGFAYQYDADTDQFAHASGVVLLTPTGRVSRYFYGIDYPTRDMRLGLVEASAGRIGTAVDELLLFCFHYDPLTGKYGLAIMRVIRAAGVLTVAGLGAFVWRSIRQERRRCATGVPPVLKC